MLATTVSKEFQQNEYAYVEIRGTGLNNHNYSYVKVDDNFLLKHAYYQGFWLFVLDRRNLQVVFQQNYNTIEDQPQDDPVLGLRCSRLSPPFTKGDSVEHCFSYQNWTVDELLKTFSTNSDLTYDGDFIYNRTNIF